jgi:hypothetical protein
METLRIENELSNAQYFQDSTPGSVLVLLKTIDYKRYEFKYFELIHGTKTEYFKHLQDNIEFDRYHIFRKDPFTEPINVIDYLCSFPDKIITIR